MKIYVKDIIRYVLNFTSRITRASKELVSFYSSCCRYTPWQKGHATFTGTEWKISSTQKSTGSNLCLVLRPLTCMGNAEFWILFLQYYTVHIKEFLGQKVDVIFGSKSGSTALTWSLFAPCLNINFRWRSQNPCRICLGTMVPMGQKQDVSNH